MPSTSMEVYCGVSGRGCDDGTGGAPKTGVAMHNRYGGVVPELASRDHVERLVPLLEQVMADAQRPLSAIKYAKVRPIRNEQGIAVDFQIEGEYPQFGNNDDRVDDIACSLRMGRTLAYLMADSESAATDRPATYLT